VGQSAGVVSGCCDDDSMRPSTVAAIALLFAIVAPSASAAPVSSIPRDASVLFALAAFERSRKR